MCEFSWVQQYGKQKYHKQLFFVSIHSIQNSLKIQLLKTGCIFELYKILVQEISIFNAKDFLGV